MLIGIPPVLGPELLAVLRAMGHGDEIAIVDGNYPAEQEATRLIRADGLELIPVLDAILTVLPVDDFVPDALFRSSVKGDPKLVDPVHDEMAAVCARRANGHSRGSLQAWAKPPRMRQPVSPRMTMRWGSAFGSGTGRPAKLAALTMAGRGASQTVCGYASQGPTRTCIGRSKSS